MKKFFEKLSALILLCSAFYVFAQAKMPISDDASMTLSYLGQQPPGETPTIFAAEFFTVPGVRLHSSPAFSPDGNQLFWSVVPPKILHSSLGPNGWSEPKAASFSERNCQAPFFSYDGERLYYHVSKIDGFGSLDIWYVDISKTGWSEPKNLGSPPNSVNMESQPSFAENGSLYFTGAMEAVAWERGIYCSKFVQGKYQTPKPLPAQINTSAIEAYPFIAADESFLLFSSSRPGNEESDLKLYVCYRNRFGEWSTAVNLSEKLGVKGAVRCGAISPDGEYLFYLLGDSFYWVNASIIKKNRPGEWK